MKIKSTLILLMITQIGLLFSQNDATLKPVASDCKTAIPITVSGNMIYGVTKSPNGFGNIQEITTKNKLLFEKEHNTAWYLLTIQRAGEFVLEIVPEDPKNDYDFLLYKYDASTFCDAFAKNTFIPLRNNLSRVDKSIQGITGLMANVKNTNEGIGVGNAYSQSISVKKGERYMLILDNVYPNGKGHTIYFNFLKQVTINGKVVDSDNKPVEAEMILSDNSGNTIEQFKSSADGNYSVKTDLKENQDYTLTSFSDSTFIQDKTLNTNTLKTENTFNEATFVLPKLKEGAKYNFGNINFYADRADLLPSSYPSAEALYQLLKKNKKLVIQIEGHINKGIVKSEKDITDNQLLSEQRATTIFNYLIKKGIAKERLSTVGLSSTQMIYPNAKNETEGKANRRVEIKITSMN
ncbi:MAG: OmpA family protein [Bacteroidia bacterium]